MHPDHIAALAVGLCFIAVPLVALACTLLRRWNRRDDK